MIWVAGRVVPDDALTVSVLDRTFEHGLGLFETFRTWSGRATLLDRHLARMTRSAQELGLPLDRGSLPTAESVSELLRANRVKGDAMLRITLTGGLSQSGGSTLWMRHGTLPTTREGGAVITFGPWEVAWGDLVTRHKTLNYWSRRAASEVARTRFFDEILSHTRDARYWEGSRTNLFIVKDGELITPYRKGPIVSGVMREAVINHAIELRLTIRETSGLAYETVFGADEVFLTNAVRGILPVASAEPGGSWAAPGPLTQRLWMKIHEWLREGGTFE